MSMHRKGSAAPEGFSETFYQCIRCRASLQLQENGFLTCALCNTTYPSIGGVKVITPTPAHLLRLQLDRLIAKRAEVAESKAKLARATNRIYSQEALLLANMSHDGQLANLDLITAIMEPAKDYLAAQAGRSLFDSFNMEDAGWPSFRMLGYFYRDWGATEEALFLTNLFADAVCKHCTNERGSAVVLGCGASRLVYDSSEWFDAVFGVDLAVDSLLLAKALLDGAEVEIHFSFPNTQVPVSHKAVKLKGPDRKSDSIDLMAASASRLPFASSSISCVMTPYLLDIVPAPDEVIAEIQRVLIPQGIWINFSNLFGTSRLTNTVQLDDLDLSSFLSRSGFALLDQRMQRYSLVDLSSVSEWARAVTETPVLMVAKKTARDNGRLRDPFADYFAGKDKSVLGMIPSVSTYIGLIHERIFSRHGMEERKRIANFTANNVSVVNEDNSRYVTDGDVAMAEGLLHLIDGSRTMGEILNLMIGQYGGTVQTNEFINLFFGLRESGFIDLKEN